MSSLRLLALRAIGAYLRHAPDHPGRWRLIGPAVALAPALRAVTRRMVVTTREGFRIEIDGSSQTARMLYATGEYESETTRIVKRFLRPGDVMVDVGANIGYFTILGARAVGPTGRVVAFEPAMAVRERLRHNIALNGLSNVEVRDEALSDTGGMTEFYSGPSDDTGLASLRPLASSERTDVLRARFDDLWRANERVSLVKIDVEGAETAVLEGMSECLVRDRPEVIVEVTDAYLRTLGSSAAALATLLINRGYAMFRIDHHGLIAVEHMAELDRGPAQFNALFTTQRGAVSP